MLFFQFIAEKKLANIKFFPSITQVVLGKVKFQTENYLYPNVILIAIGKHCLKKLNSKNYSFDVNEIFIQRTHDTIWSCHLSAKKISKQYNPVHLRSKILSNDIHHWWLIRHHKKESGMWGFYKYSYHLFLKHLWLRIAIPLTLIVGQLENVCTH